MNSLGLTLCALLVVGLAGKSFAAENRYLRALLICGGCCHDYAAQKDILKKGLEARARVVVDTLQQGGTARESRIPAYEDPNWARGYDVIIHDDCFGAVGDTNWIAKILAPHRAGVPGVNLHCAMHSYRVTPGDDWQRYLGLRSMKHGAATPIDIRTVNTNHAIIAGLGWREWRTGNEELYNNVNIFETATPLQRGKQGAEDCVITWVNQYGKTRVFNTTLGHFNETVSDPRYLDLVTRGLLWACGKLDAEHLQPLLPLPAEKTSALPEPKKPAR